MLWVLTSIIPRAIKFLGSDDISLYKKISLQILMLP